MRSQYFSCNRRLNWKRQAFLVKRIYCFAASDRGATVIEYSLIAALIAGVLIAGFFAVGADLGALFGQVKIKIDTLH